MDLKLICEYICGGLTIEFVLAFYFYAFLGMFLTLLLHLSSAVSKHMKNAKPFRFKVKFWIKDNWVRILTNIITIFIIIRFYDSLHLQYKLDMFLGFMVGLTIDAIIIFVRKKTTINIFQSKFNT